MPSDRHRILQLALDSLQNKKKQIDQEIADIRRELRSGAAGRTLSYDQKATGAKSTVRKKQSRFSKEERLRRSQRMKAYWDNWRKKKSRMK